MIKNVVITAGYKQSLHSLALAHSLIQNGIKIRGIIVVKTFQVKRIRFYIKQYGLRTVKEKFLSLILKRSGSGLSDETRFIKEYIAEKKCKAGDLFDFAQRHQIPVKQVNSLNHNDSLKFLKERNPEAVVYSGGGILKKAFISLASVGVFNAHSGLLPYFRGMNVIEWSLLYGIKPYTTVHFIESGIDTGQIIFKKPLPLEGLKNLSEYRGMGTRNEIESLVEVLTNYDKYNGSLIGQSREDGKQFFVIHPFLRKRVEGIIKNKLSLTEDIQKRRFGNKK